MRKSLGNKRNEISQSQIGDLTRIHGDFTHGETRDLADEDPVTHQPRTRPRVVSKIFANQDFGYRKITVERPLRRNFAATPERIARLEHDKAFQNLATSKKQDADKQQADIAAGCARQQQIRSLLESVADATDNSVIRDREAFLATLTQQARAKGIRLSAAERKAVLGALAESDPQASICYDSNGDPEPDPGLRNTETMPLQQNIDDHMAHDVLPHIPDAWVDHTKTKTGYEIPLNRHFYVYEPPRALDEIDADLHALEREIVGLLAEVTS